MAKRYEGQVVLITGGATGIGACICKEFAKEGAMVICNHSHSERSKKEYPILEKEIKKEKGLIEDYEADVSDYDEVCQMIKDIKAKYGHLDVLVCNHMRAVAKKFDQITKDDVLKMVNSDIIGTFYCAQQAIIQMVEQQFGSVVFVSSNASVNGGAGSVLYPMCKGAVESLMRGFNSEVSDKNVRVNTVRPGWVATELNMHRYSPEDYQAYLNCLPMKRAGKPEEIAKCVLFLADGNNIGYVNGAILDADGARTYTLRPKYK